MKIYVLIAWCYIRDFQKQSQANMTLGDGENLDFKLYLTSKQSALRRFKFFFLIAKAHPNLRLRSSTQLESTT